MRCVEPVKVIEILRLTEQGYSQREIARSVKCGKSTVADVQKCCRECNLQYHKAAQMTDEEIKKLLYPNSFDQPKKDDPDWPVIHERLQSNKRLNLQYLWEEYRAENSQGLSYSRFAVVTPTGKMKPAKASSWLKTGNREKNCLWTGWVILLIVSSTVLPGN